LNQHPAIGELNSHPELAWILDINGPVKSTSCAAPKLSFPGKCLTIRTLNGVIRVMGFLPANFQLPMPFRSLLRVAHSLMLLATDAVHRRTQSSCC